VVKILFIHNSSKIGGAETSLLHLVDQLDASRFSAEVVLPEEGPLYHKLKGKVPVYLVGMRRTKRTHSPFRIFYFLFAYTVSAWKLLRLVRKLDPDIIHSNVTGAHIYAGPVGWLMKKPVIWHIRDLIPGGWLVRMLSFFSKTQICISNYVAEHAGILQHKKTRVIYNGTPIARESETHSRNLGHLPGIPAGAFVIGQVGQLIPSKRHLDLVQLAARIVPRYPHVRFVITGADLFGEYNDYIQSLWKAIDEKGLRDYFIFLGQVDNVDGVMEMIDLLFHPSRSEPFGRVIIEAMAKGKPVIGVSRCGPREIVVHEQTGLLFEPGDLDAMEAGLISLINQPARIVALGKAARKHAREHFAIGNHVRTIEKEYYSLTS
jgi:L-malate glycosyltransferase